MMVPESATGSSDSEAARFQKSMYRATANCRWVKRVRPKKKNLVAGRSFDSQTPPVASPHYFQSCRSRFSVTLGGKGAYIATGPIRQPRTSILILGNKELRLVTSRTVIARSKGTHMNSGAGLKTPIFLRARWLTLVAFMLLCLAAGAQSTQEVQFLPEVNAYLKLNPSLRLSAQAKDTREGGDPTQAEIGPSIEYYVKPLSKLKEITRFDLDDAKTRPLVLTAGYRYLSSPTSPSTNRVPIAATSHFPIKAKLLLTDRNRADLDWNSGSFTWRYRNMLTFERTLAIQSYHLIPYASVEFYYESQYRKWST